MRMRGRPRRGRGAAWAGAVALVAVFPANGVPALPRVGVAAAATSATTTAPATSAPATAPSNPVPGYWLENPNGGVFSFGTRFYGSADSTNDFCRTGTPGGACYSMAATPGGTGYWILDTGTGQVRAYGSAAGYGDPAGTAGFAAMGRYRPRPVQIVATPDGKGYWVLEQQPTGLGTVAAFGDAVDYGDQQTVHATASGALPVALLPTPDGKGYWIVGNDGGVFSFGDARFYGSLGAVHLAKPVVAAAPTWDGRGYWMTAGDGGVFGFGDAQFAGSLASVRLAAPIVSIAADQEGPGYWLASADGGVFAMGGARFLGSMGGRPLDRPISAIVAPPPSSVWTMWTMRSSAGQPEILLAPRGPVKGVVLYEHGTGGHQDEMLDLPLLFPLRDALLEGGLAVAASYSHGSNWGNPASVQDQVDLLADARRQLLPVSTVDIVGFSMGGADALMLASDHVLPGLRNVLLLSAVCDQIAFMQQGVGPIAAPLITAAYGGLTGQPLLDAIAPNDPTDRDPHTFAGYNYWFWQSPEDGFVLPTETSTLMARMSSAGVPALYSPLDGNHGDLALLQLDQIVQWMSG